MQTLYQRDGDGMLGRHNCLSDRLEAVSNMFRPQDHQMRWSGICTNRHDFPQPSPDRPEIRSCGTCFARLVGKFTHRGRGLNCPRILLDAKQTGGLGPDLLRPGSSG